MKKVFISLFAVILVFSAVQKVSAHDADFIVALEYYRFPDEMDGEDDAKYRVSFNFGLGGNYLFTERFGIRAQTNFHVPVLTLIADALSDDEDTNTDFGFGWSVGIGPVFKFPISNEETFEVSVQIQNFLATDYWPEGKYKGGSDSFALGGEFLYRYKVGLTGGFAAGIAYYKIFNEYFFNCKERYRGFNKGFIIRPEITFNMKF